MTCTVCRHEARDQIDLLLLSGDSERSIAQRFGLNAASVHRHKESHLPGTVAATAHREGEAQRSLNVMKQLRAINLVTLGILQDARKKGHSELALKSVDRVMKQLELQSRLLGELSEGVSVNVYAAPEWLALRAVVVQALLPYPEASRAVAEALAEEAS